MDFKEYSEKASTTAMYPNRGHNIYYPALGLSGEAGEVSEKVKKIMRDSNGEMSDETREAIAKECGDVLWYINAMAFEIGIPLEDIAAKNIEKLFSRKARGVLHGSGDNR